MIYLFTYRLQQQRLQTEGWSNALPLNQLPLAFHYMTCRVTGLGRAVLQSGGVPTSPLRGRLGVGANRRDTKGELPLQTPAAAQEV